MKPRGIGNLNSAEEAKASARQTFPGESFAVLRQNGKFSWVVPANLGETLPMYVQGVELIEIVPA